MGYLKAEYVSLKNVLVEFSLYQFATYGLWMINCRMPLLKIIASKYLLNNWLYKFALYVRLRPSQDVRNTTLVPTLNFPITAQRLAKEHLLWQSDCTENSPNICQMMSKMQEKTFWKGDENKTVFVGSQRLDWRPIDQQQTANWEACGGNMAGSLATIDTATIQSIFSL